MRTWAVRKLEMVNRQQRLRAAKRSQPFNIYFLHQSSSFINAFLSIVLIDFYATKVFCPPWYWNRGPGWLSSQGVLQSDKTQISAQMSNFLRVRLHKQPDAWPEGVPLPLAFDCYATKVICPPWNWNRGPGWLSSQGVLQSE